MTPALALSLAANSSEDQFDSPYSYGCSRKCVNSAAHPMPEKASLATEERAASKAPATLMAGMNVG